MGYRYKKAAVDDLDLLVDTRIKVLRAANQLSDDVDMSEIRVQSYRYYSRALCDGTHIAYLVFDGQNLWAPAASAFFR